MEHVIVGGVEDMDIIIVGAGVAGAALAYALGMDGRQVHVIERDLMEQDRIVGELLQPGGYLMLEELGLKDCVQEIDAQRLLGYALYLDGKTNRISYPLKTSSEDVTGYCFRNGLFVQRLREKAMTVPSVKLEQGSVTSLIEENGTIKGVIYKSKSSGQELKAYAPLTVICDGCFSNLRRALCSPKVDLLSYYIALTLENCPLPYANHVHIVLGNPSAIGFFPISSTEVRCGIDVPGQKLPSISGGEMTKYLKNIIAPQVPTDLQETFISAIEKGNIRSVQTKSMPAAPLIPKLGALLIGDAFNMRHPSTGGGMSVALSDVVVLRNLLKSCDLDDASSVAKCLDSFYTLRKPLASTVNITADALYKLVSNWTDEASIEMTRALFDFINFGGVYSTRSLALIAVLNPRPFSVVCLLFVVGVYAVARQLVPFPSPRKLWLSAKLILVGLRIMFPIIKSEGFRQIFFPATVSAYSAP